MPHRLVTPGTEPAVRLYAAPPEPSFDSLLLPAAYQEQGAAAPATHFCVRRATLQWAAAGAGGFAIVIALYELVKLF